MRRITKRARNLVAALLLAAARLPLLSAEADEAGATHITIRFVEVHDRLDPDPVAGISRAVTVNAVLTRDGHVHESDSTEVRKGAYFSGAHGSNEATLGDTSSRAVWRVQGANRLQRVVVGKQFVAIADIEIGQGGTCSVQVKFVLEKGFTSVIMKRSDNGEFAKFSLQRVTSASCSIE